MSKNAIVGVTVLLCVLAAGVGGFFATKMGTAHSIPAATTTSLAPAQPSTAMAVAPVTAAATEGVIPEPPASAVPTQAEPTSPANVATPAATMAPAAKRPSAPKAIPVSKPAPTAPPAPPPADSSWTGLDKQWPSGTTSADVTTTEPPVTAPPPVEPQVAQPPPVATPSPAMEPQFEALEVEADAVLGLKLDSTVNSETARLEDPVEAHVSRDVRVGSLVAIPSGTRVLGVVSQVEKGGRMKNRSRLGVRFHTLVLADGTRTTIQTDAIYREGEAPGQEAAGKMGAAAAGGAILGAILGGSKGAAIGGSIGAAGGAAAVMAGERNAAVLKAGTSVTVRLVRPVAVTVPR